MKATIMGSGFGLYGYLPAMTDCGYEVILPSRYRQKVLERKELKRLYASAIWMDNFDGILSKVDTVVIAKPPEQQEKIALHLLNFPNIKEIFLEKPLAVSPREAGILLSALSKSKKTIHIGYLFLYESWLREVEKFFGSHLAGKFSLSWKFMAHHFLHNLNNWKRFHNQGGGVLRFYAIHILAVLAYLRFDDVILAALEGENSLFRAKFRRRLDGAQIDVEVDSRNEKNVFAIDSAYGCIYSGSSPFTEKPIADIDSRVGLLRHHICAGKEKDWLSIYVGTIDLWEKVERLL